jgi:hypothetical protein
VTGRQVDHAGSIAGMAVTLIGDYAERIEALAFALPADDERGHRLARLAGTMRDSEQLLHARVQEMTRLRIP